MDFLIDSITRKNTRISFFYLTVYFNRNRFNGLSLFVQCCTVCNADMFAFLKLRQLANISCIRCFDTCFDVDDTACHSLFPGLANRFTDRNDTVMAIRCQDIPLRYLTAIAEGYATFNRYFSFLPYGHTVGTGSRRSAANGNGLTVRCTCLFTNGNRIIAARDGFIPDSNGIHS